MNYIDLAVILIVIVCMALGLLGKLWKRLIIMVMVIASIPISYLVANSLTEKYANMPATEIAILKETDSTVTVTEWIVNKANSVEAVKTIYDNSPSFASMLDNSPEMIVKVLLFYVIGIIGFIVAPIVGTIIYWLLKLFMSDKEKRKGAIYLFGIPSGVMALVITIFVISPIIMFSPIIHEATNAFKSSESPNATVLKVLETVDGQTDGSKVITTGSDFLEKNPMKMLCYEAEEEGTTKTYYFYGELKDIAVIIALYSNVQDDVKAITAMEDLDLTSTNSVDELVNLLDTADGVLTDLDTMRKDLSNAGHISGIINDLLKYYLDTYPDSLSNDNGLAFLKRMDLTDFDFADASLKDDLLPLIIQALVDELAINGGYEFLADLNIKEMTFADIKKEIANIANMVTLFNGLSTSDFSEMTSEEVETLVASLAGSEIVKTALEGALEESGLTLPADFSVEDIDFAAEAPLIADIVTVAQEGDFTNLGSEELADLADDISTSELAQVVVLDVSAAEYTSMESELAGKVSSGELSEEQKATLLGLFNNAG